MHGVPLMTDLHNIVAFSALRYRNNRHQRKGVHDDTHMAALPYYRSHLTTASYALKITTLMATVHQLQ